MEQPSEIRSIILVCPENGALRGPEAGPLNGLEVGTLRSFRGAVLGRVSGPRPFILLTEPYVAMKREKSVRWWAQKAER